MFAGTETQGFTSLSKTAAADDPVALFVLLHDSLSTLSFMPSEMFLNATTVQQRDIY